MRRFNKISTAVKKFKSKFKNRLKKEKSKIYKSWPGCLVLIFKQFPEILNKSGTPLLIDFGYCLILVIISIVFFIKSGSKKKHVQKRSTGKKTKTRK